MKHISAVLFLLFFAWYSVHAQCGLDIFIANDQSGSVDDVENRQSRLFITELVRNLTPLGNANDQSRVAIAEWDKRDSWKQFDFPQAGKNYTTDLGEIISFQNSPRTLSGLTDPYDVLLKTYKAINQTPVVGRNTNKVIVLMTDAACNQIQSNIVELAKQIKDEGIYIIVLAIDAAANCPILQGSNIASPSGYFNANSYTELQQQIINYAKNIIRQACNFPPPLPLSFDLSIQLNDFQGTNCQSNGSGGNYIVNYTVSNTGDAAFNNTLKIIFYDGDPRLPRANVVGIQTLNNTNIGMNGIYSGSFTGSSLSSSSRLYAAVNIEETASTPLPDDVRNILFIKPEKYANNNISFGTYIINDTFCKSKPIINTSVNHTGIACDSTITYNIELCNTGNATAIINSFNPVAPAQFILKDSISVLESLESKRLWATYYGGNGVDQARDLAKDAHGNIYMLGSTSSDNSIATSGAHQETRNGPSQDIYLVKFNSNGERQWGTYYGSTGMDVASAVAIDAQGNVFVAGNVSGYENIATIGAHQSTKGGGDWDAVLVKFNSNGERQWATYYGGSVSDLSSGLVIDADGNVFMAGSSASTNNIATSGAHQSISAGNGDAFLVKFNNNGERQWATYYGGAGSDEATALAMDIQGNVYMTGYTFSGTNIATSGAYQSVPAGNSDAFLVKFNNNGERQWATYYGGSNSEQSRALAIDELGNIFMAGNTTSIGNIATNDAHQPAHGGNNDAFLVKFNSDGAPQWATYYGDIYNDMVYDLDTDTQGSVYMTGYTPSTDNIATTGAYQEAHGGVGYNAFLVSFNSNGERQWATYYGGYNNSYGIAVLVDEQGEVYLAGNAGNDNNLTTTGSHQEIFGGGSDDALLVKFAIEKKGLFIPSNSCKKIQYTYHIGNASSGTYNYSVGFTAATQNPGTEAEPIILPDNNFNAGTYTNLNGFNGANHTTDNAVITTSLPAACLPGDKVSTAVSISSNNTCSSNFTQATITISNTSGVDILNSVMELNLTGTGAAFAGEMYNISSNLSYQVSNVLHIDYPNVPNALYTKTGKIRIPLWKLPVGTTTFNIDISLGAPTTNLSVKIDNINTNYNATGQSNTAALSQAVAVPATATISGFSCHASISAGNNINFSGISTTNASSVKWVSSTVTNIPNTGTVANPAIVYTPTPKDIANGFVAISLTVLNSNGCETTKSCQININNIVYDYGDAPITYDLNKNIQPYAGSATLHSGIYLGTTAPGSENTAKSSANATGDGNEEDGLANSCGSKPVNLQLFPLTVKATNNSNSIAYIGAFIDWNNDGDYLDDGETVLNIVQANNNSGTKDYILQFKPETANTSLNKYFVRLRISTDSNSIKQPYGTAPHGEVEDHLMELGSSSTFTNPQSICQGSSYSINGKNYITAGVYRDTLKNAAVGGCDSIIVTNLTIKPSSTSNNPQSICQGSSYSINGKNYTTAGAYRDTLKNATAGGCDSIIVTNLTLQTSSTFNNPQSICQGSSYSINGKNYTAVGTYIDTLKNAAVDGCDSIIVTNLTVNASVTYNNPQSICQGSSYSINGKNYTTAGVYRDTLKNAAVGGCDSIIVTNLTVNASVTYNNPQSICQGSSYSINGKNYITAGVYRDTLKNTATGGCDSIIITNLTTTDTVKITLNKSVCTEQSFSVGNETFNTTGNYIIYMKSEGGCDSLVHLDLIVLEEEISQEKRTICPEEIIYWNDQEIASEGLYQEVFTNTTGCDSIAQLLVTIRDTCSAESKDCYLLFPNVFTPNGDGTNDIFRPIYNCAVENYLLEIYNRWGILVFTSTDPKKGWNGYSDKETIQDNYIYHATVTMNHQHQSVKGFVLVIP